MGVFIGILLGLALAVGAFLAMRDPVKWALLAPGTEGYYRRLVLDRGQRFSLRVVSALVSLFGLMILAAALSALLTAPALKLVSRGLLVEVIVLFVGTMVCGVIELVVQILRGRPSIGLRILTGGSIGPIADSPITPEIRNEANQFTVGFVFLLAVAISAALYRR